MTIATVRMDFWPPRERERLRHYLDITQGGFSLLPLLTRPREAWFGKQLYSGDQLELAMANARRDAAPALREARYLGR